MTYTTKTTTNNHWHDFESLPSSEAHNFDWLGQGEQHSYTFLRYKGAWYHLSQFTRLHPAERWHGAHADSAWGGVVIRISEDGDRYQIGTQRTVSV